MKKITIKLFEFSELSDSAKEKARQWWRDGNDFDESCLYEEACVQAEALGITIGEIVQRGASGRQYTKKRIWYSGFYSQGDGACFEGSWRASDMKPDKVADGWGECQSRDELFRIRDQLNGIASRFPFSSFKVEHSGHYYHRFCTAFDVDSGVDEMTVDQLRSWRSGDDESDDPNENEDFLSVQQLYKDRAEEDFPEAFLIELARDFMLWIYKRLEVEWDYQNSDEQVDESITYNEYHFYEDGTRAREE